MRRRPVLTMGWLVLGRLVLGLSVALTLVLVLVLAVALPARLDPQGHRPPRRM